MIKLLNLYRCDSDINSIDKMDYTVMDYFDAIKVEDIDENKATLASCVGIDQNEIIDNKEGVSHQRYCLYAKENNEDIFKIDNRKYPLITVIQIFINPDIYQGEQFKDGTKITCEQCIRKADIKIKSYVKAEQLNIKWKIFHLLSEGDFAIIVRSKHIHDAFDISTLMRSIKVSVNGEIKTNALFSYSITGISNVNDNAYSEWPTWSAYLKEEDCFILRMEYSSDFRIAKRENNMNNSICNFLSFGYQLYGRYDFQIKLSPEAFDKIYPYLWKYKFFKNKEIKSDINSIDILDVNDNEKEKIKMLLWMLENKYISYINERILIKDFGDLFIQEGDIWEINVKDEWKSIYELNQKEIKEQKEIAIKLGRILEPYYQSANVLRDYVRLLKRLYRILFEMNQYFELRVGVANLLKQVRVLVLSLMDFEKIYREDNQMKKELADSLEENLRQGIAAIEIFARYVRNINLQTLQTPNYDLQTNVCIEKILLSFSQFFKSVLKKNIVADWQTTNKLYPILVPSMSVVDLSVSVLFDDCNKTEDNEQKERLLVVSSPSIDFLCQTCFMIPTSFHEIGHQFRYEDRQERNKVVVSYIFHILAEYFIVYVLEDFPRYRFMDETVIGDLVSKIASVLQKNIMQEAMYDLGTHIFTLQLNDTIKNFSMMIQEMKTDSQSIVSHYIKETGIDTSNFTEEIMMTIENLYNLCKEEEENNKAFSYDKLSRELDNLSELQLELIYQELSDLVKRDSSGLFQSDDFESEVHFNLFLKKYQENRQKEFPCKEDIFDRIKKISHIKTIKKQCDFMVQELIRTETVQKKCNLDEMSREIFENFLIKIETFIKERDDNLDFETISVTSEELQFLYKRIKLMGEKGISRKISSFFGSVYNRKLYDTVYNSIDLYREVTADLYMCSMMGLEVWGYLVVVAETFVFRGDTKSALFRRIFLVVQCLLKDESKPYTLQLFELWKQKWEILSKKARLSYLIPEDEILQEDIVDYILKILDSLLKDGASLSSTEKWIVKMFQQITVLIFNISGIISSKEEVSDKILWRDIYNNAFQTKGGQFELFENEPENSQLCEGIAQILNNPEMYFGNRKSLLNEEIQFVLANYEENCKDLWR